MYLACSATGTSMSAGRSTCAAAMRNAGMRAVIASQSLQTGWLSSESITKTPIVLEHMERALGIPPASSTTFGYSSAIKMEECSPSRNRQKTRPSSGLGCRRCERKQTPQNRVIATKGKSWEKTVVDASLPLDNTFLVIMGVVPNVTRKPPGPAPDAPAPPTIILATRRHIQMRRRLRRSRHRF